MIYFKTNDHKIIVKCKWGSRGALSSTVVHGGLGVDSWRPWCGFMAAVVWVHGGLGVGS